VGVDRVEQFDQFFAGVFKLVFVDGFFLVELFVDLFEEGVQFDVEELEPFVDS
jgi:hypothetical protein